MAKDGQLSSLIKHLDLLSRPLMRVAFVDSQLQKTSSSVNRNSDLRNAVEGAHQAAFESHKIEAGTAAACRKSANAGCFSGEEKR